MKNTIDINKLEMREIHLNCPVKTDDLIQLQLGDLVYLSGIIFTGREGTVSYTHLTLPTTPYV